MIRWPFLLLLGAGLILQISIGAPLVLAQEPIQGPELVIETVPPIPGYKFELGSTEFKTDDAGIARISPESVSVTQSLRAVESSVPVLRKRAIFSRWCCGIGDVDRYQLSLQGESRVMRKLLAGEGVHVIAGFSVEYLVNLEFVDLTGRPVDPERISSVALTSSIGEKLTIAPHDNVWLLGTRVQQASGTFFVKDVRYSIQEVLVDGANVVNRSQQRFLPSEGTSWQIELLFYSASFTVRDALFRFPIGSSISLEFPDGHKEQASLSDNASVRFPSLARGEYQITVHGQGISFQRPVRLSRDQQIELVFISYLDIVVVGVVALAAIASLVLLGRPGLRRTIFSLVRRPSKG